MIGRDNELSNNIEYEEVSQGKEFVTVLNNMTISRIMQLVKRQVAICEHGGLTTEV